MKRYIVAVLVFVLLFSQSVVAGEKELIRTDLVKTEPINVLRYAKQQVNYLVEILKRLQETGKPVLMFDKQDKVGLEATLVEDWPKRNFNVVGGASWVIQPNDNSESIRENKGAEWFIGLEYELSLVGGMWEIFKKFGPAVYLSEGELYWGFSFEFRPKPE